MSMSEFARVLGGGMVPGSIVLLGGDPGIGKSTLMLQVAAEIARDSRVLYASGEESARQIKMRAQRLNANGQTGDLPKNLYLVTETNLEAILAHTEQVKPALLAVDSIQTVYLDGLSSSAGSVAQVRECAARLRELAKSSGIAVFLIGHVTKEGVIAGPRVLEPHVDTVLQLEGDRFQSYRLLRSMKNRFGPTPRWACSRCASRAWPRFSIPPKLSWPKHGGRARFGHRGDHGRHAPHPGGVCRG